MKPVSEADYLRAELLAAKTLLARASGLMQADAVCMRILHGVDETDCQKRLLAEIEACHARGVHVLPEGVVRA